MTTRTAFNGSYAANEVDFLLTPLQLPDTSITDKEILIQSGQSHYSQLLTHEQAPAEAYTALFHQALVANGPCMAGHVLALAAQIVATRPQGITLVSLARAGTPVGVLLKHVLKRYFQQHVRHYSVSIVRDVGLDQNALRYILQQHRPETLVFVDGWTGKGVIARQLASSLAAFADSDNVAIPAELYVLTDLSGSAKVAASNDDYLIPSCILNATVSGLVSRSVYNKAHAHAGDFHGCVFYGHLAPYDLSRYFIDALLAHIEQAWQHPTAAAHHLPAAQLKDISEKWLDTLITRYRVKHPHYIKPGIGESTRVLLRREARLLLLQDANAEATRHLRWLAEAKAIPITIISDLPYRAVALIKEIPL